MAQLGFPLPSLPVPWLMVRFANRPRTPSVQSHCLTTFNPCVLIGVCVTNDSPDTLSGCPAQMSDWIVFTCSAPDLTMSYPYRLETGPANQLVRYAVHPRGPHSTQSPASKWHSLWELSQANQPVRYAVHPKGPHGTRSPTVHHTAPFGLPRDHRMFIAPDPWAAFLQTSCPNGELSGCPTAEPWVQSFGNCNRGNWTLHLSAWCTNPAF